MKEEEQYLDAAKKIREDPELPDELVPEIDKLLEAVTNTEGDEQVAAVDDLVVGLRRHRWTGRRLDELVLGGERAAVTWTDGQLSGEKDGPSDLLEFKCQAPDCGFINKLAFRPPDDDMPPCQNPKGAAHTLVL